MKRLICAMLCLVMAALCAGSGLAATSYTLPEKMEKQLSIGSGLKGSLTFHGEGNAPLILSLQAFQDVELQFRGMKSGTEGHYYAYQAGEDEEQKGLTELYIQENAIYLRSDFLPGEVFSLPGVAKTLDELLQPAGGNPSIASALWRWLEKSPESRSALLDPVTEKLGSQLEIWVAQFATVSPVRTLENGQSVMDLSYVIPMSEVRKEIITLWTALMGDEQGIALLDALLDDEQKAVFTNQNLIYFYEAAMAAQDSDYDVLYTRTVSTLGNHISSSLELPLDENQTHYQSLTLEENGGLLSLTLRNEDQLLTLLFSSSLDLSQVDSFSGWMIQRPNPSSDSGETVPYRALRLEVNHSSAVSTDEESRDHEHITWTLNVVRDVSRLPEGEDEANYPEEEPVRATLNLHYYSRYSQSSPTTLEFDAALDMADCNMTITGQAKTASPWLFLPFSAEGAVSLTSLTPDTLNLKLAEFLAAASEQLTPAPVAAETPEPVILEQPDASPETDFLTENDDTPEAGETANETEADPATAETATDSTADAEAEVTETTATEEGTENNSTVE